MYYLIMPWLYLCNQTALTVYFIYDYLTKCRVSDSCCVTMRIGNCVSTESIKMTLESDNLSVVLDFLMTFFYMITIIYVLAFLPVPK